MTPEYPVSSWFIVAILAMILLAFGCSKRTENSEEAAVEEPPGATFTNEQIRGIVERERGNRTDLPDPFPKSRWSARREGDYYVYIEWALPERPEFNQIFKLNRDGVIVDVQSGIGLNKHMECPDRVFTEAELGEIVAKARADQDDLPPPFANYRTRVSRLRCLYLYYEYQLPERRGDFQVFTIDPLGGLMDFSRNEPY